MRQRSEGEASVGTRRKVGRQKVKGQQVEVSLWAYGGWMQAVPPRLSLIYLSKEADAGREQELSDTVRVGWEDLFSEDEGTYASSGRCP